VFKLCRTRAFRMLKTEVVELSAVNLIITNKPSTKGQKCVIALRNYLSQVCRNVSLRHCYYYLFSQKLISPTDNDYKNLSRWLEWAKRKKQIPWDSIIDTSREIHKLTLAGDIVGYVKNETGRHYTRDYWKEQDYLIIVLCEKEAIAPSIIESIAVRYGVPIFVTRGYLSYGSLYQDIVKFLQRYSAYNLPIVVLVLSDFDVDGMIIFEGIKEKFSYAQEEWGIQTHKIERIALTQNQIQTLNLSKFEYPLFKDKQQDFIDLLNKYGWGNFPKSSQNKSENQMGKKLTKSKAFVQNYGLNGVELDVLTPQQLTSIVEDAIKPYFNFPSFSMELERERLEKESLVTGLIIDQADIDNALNQQDINNLDNKLAAEKARLGL
jgi:hypothetical protein